MFQEVLENLSRFVNFCLPIDGRQQTGFSIILVSRLRNEYDILKFIVNLSLLKCTAGRQIDWTLYG